LVLPNAEFFPDRFDGSPTGLDRLLQRMLKHAGLSDQCVTLAVAQAEAADAGGSCSSGGCGPALPATTKLQRVREVDGDYVVTILPQEVGHPSVITTVMARAAAHIFMLEAELYDDFEPAQAEMVVDAAAVMLGFGVLLGNGSYVYSKGCGGARIASATRLGVEEVATLLAIYCKLHRVPARTVARELDPTAREMFDEASVWSDANAGVVRLVASDPTAVEADSYALNEARGWFSRLFGLGRAKGPSVPVDEELERVAKQLSVTQRRSEAERQRLAALSELVDEALDAEAPGAAPERG
jgi:hypothetical protein